MNHGTVIWSTPSASGPRDFGSLGIYISYDGFLALSSSLKIWGLTINEYTKIQFFLSQDGITQEQMIAEIVGPKNDHALELKFSKPARFICAIPIVMADQQGTALFSYALFSRK